MPLAIVLLGDKSFEADARWWHRLDWWEDFFLQEIQGKGLSQTDEWADCLHIQSSLEELTLVRTHRKMLKRLISDTMR